MRIAWASNVNHGNYVDWCFMTVRSRSNMMRFLNSIFICYIVNGLFEFQSNNIPLKNFLFSGSCYLKMRNDMKIEDILRNEHSC